MKFRIITHKTNISSGYDIKPDVNSLAVRQGTLWEIELWLYKISFVFNFIYWSETE